ncbi:7TM chemoreceptor [Trinorchestia longiramus]|nr:7TM chemoreceptor [Trinorchestia longiramus]
MGFATNTREEKALANHSKDINSLFGKKSWDPPQSFCQEELLRKLKKKLILVDVAIEQISDVFSWIFIFFTCWMMCDLVFGLYLLVTSVMAGDSEIFINVVYATEAICFMLLIHNPADALADAEQHFVLRLRMLVDYYENKFSSRDLGLALALQRPRKFSLDNFGDIGRSSFINTLAFMMSYVVVTVQFSVTSPAAPPSDVSEITSAP